MLVESRVFSLSWVPSDVVGGIARLPFAIGVAEPDRPPPDRVDDPYELVRSGRARQANTLRAWVEFDEEGRPASWGYREPADDAALAASLALPPLRQEPEHGGFTVRFVQSAGGRLGGSVPHRVRGKPFLRFEPPVSWTTLALTIGNDGSARGELVGASPFPRHWIYGEDGVLQAKSAEVSYRRWLAGASLPHTPWGAEDSPQLLAAAESALERRLSARIMAARPRVETVYEGMMLVEQGDLDDTVFLVLDGVLDVCVGGQVVAQVGPGAIVGERAAIEGRRSAGLRARTACRVVALESSALTVSEREQLAAAHRREND
jgi:hypothetical protein